MTKRRSIHWFKFRASMGKGSYFALVAMSLLLFLAFWQFLSDYQVFPEAFFPAPRRVWSAAVTMFCSQAFHLDVLASAGRIGFAFVVSAALAVPLGLLMSSFKPIEALVEPLVDFVHYVPVPALMPLFVLWGGIGETSKFLVLFFGTFFQLVLLIMDDADNVPRIQFDLARTLGATTPQLFRDVLVPYLLPQIYDRLRVTLGWCWTYLIIAELVAVQRGVGHAIKESQRFNAADQMFVCCIVLGLIGLLTDLAAKLAYRHLFPYAAKASLQAY